MLNIVNVFKSNNEEKVLKKTKTIDVFQSSEANKNIQKFKKSLSKKLNTSNTLLPNFQKLKNINSIQTDQFLFQKKNQISNKKEKSATFIKEDENENENNVKFEKENNEENNEKYYFISNKVISNEIKFNDNIQTDSLRNFNFYFPEHNIEQIIQKNKKSLIINLLKLRRLRKKKKNSMIKKRINLFNGNKINPMKKFEKLKSYKSTESKSPSSSKLRKTFMFLSRK